MVSWTDFSDSENEFVVVVTGGASGIGAGCCEAFGALGAQVVSLDLSSQSASATQRFVALECDVADRDAVASSFDEIESRLGMSPMTLVNAAGTFEAGLALEIDLEAWRRTIEINLTGTFIASREFARRLRSGRSNPSIVNISSIHGVQSASERSAYAASKAAVESLTRSLALEWGPKGIRTNAVAPSHTDTLGIAKAAEQGYLNLASVRRRIPMGRIASVEEVAEAVVFLGSRSARFINGAILPVDGGYGANGGWLPVGSTAPSASSE